MSRHGTKMSHEDVLRNKEFLKMPYEEPCSNCKNRIYYESMMSVYIACEIGINPRVNGFCKKFEQVDK